MAETTLPEGVSRDEFTQLSKAVGELGDALKELRDAGTREEKEEAREDVAEAKADLHTLAKEMGIPYQRLQKAAEQAKRDEEKERIRPLLLELLDEELGGDDDENDEDDEDGSGKPLKPNPKPSSAPDSEPEPAPDTEPVVSHWSNRKLSDFFR